MSVTFDTVLTGGGTASGIVVPEEIMAQLGPAKRSPVVVTVGDYSYRSSVSWYKGAFKISVSSAVKADAGLTGVKHQSGAKQIDDLRAAYAAAGVEAQLLPFIDDVAARYAVADLVVCRAGALTIAELAAGGVASVLGPFPQAVDDHQTGNARFLSEAGAAILLPQRELTPEKLAALLRELTREKLAAMAEKARALAKREATRAVAEVCMEAAR